MTVTTKRINWTNRTKRSQRGMVTAEYAVGVVFACGLAGACLATMFASPLIRSVLAVLWRHALERWL
ncbi:MAG: DUF4244 domain-containing protein [Nocardioidaceae bacterium]